jgi:hypothetical protein
MSWIIPQWFGLKLSGQKFGDSSKDWNVSDEAYINKIGGFTAIELTDIASLEQTNNAQFIL